MGKHGKVNKKNINKAIALSYDRDESAPKIIAKGEGLIARNIIEKGLEEKIAIYEDGDLVDNLMGLEINDEIPVELYEVVAEIIFYVYNLDINKGR